MLCHREDRQIKSDWLGAAQYLATTERRAPSQLLASPVRTFPAVAPSVALRDFVSPNGEDILYYHCDRLHQWPAAHRPCLRESARRRHRALSPAERRRSFLSDRRRSTRAEGPTIRRESRRRTAAIRR